MGQVVVHQLLVLLPLQLAKRGDRVTLDVHLENKSLFFENLNVILMFNWKKHLTWK